MAAPAKSGPPSAPTSPARPCAALPPLPQTWRPSPAGSSNATWTPWPSSLPASTGSPPLTCSNSGGNRPGPYRYLARGAPLLRLLYPPDRGLRPRNERTYSTIRPDWPDPDPDDQEPLPPNKRGSHSKNLPKESPGHVRQYLRRITGIDLTAVDGISFDLAQKIINEIGTDMSRFPTEKPFCSWLKLAPNNQITGGKIYAKVRGGIPADERPGI